MTTTSHPADERIPVTVLTGFLGAGKTTLLNRLLSENHGERIAVIENEFGEESVDNGLLIRGNDEQIVEVNNGCICCTVRGDLVRILNELVRRRQAGVASFARVIIETTGLADPAPVAQTFFIEEDIARHYVLDAVVTVVDALHASKQLDSSHEAQEQVGFADRVLVSKTDLVQATEVKKLLSRLQAINSRAIIEKLDLRWSPLPQLLGISGFSLTDILNIEPTFLEPESHEHDDAVKSFSYKSDREFDGTKLRDFLHELVNKHGQNLMRYKAIVVVSGLERRLIVQGVHMVINADLGASWASDEARESRFAFIGRDLPTTMIETRLTGAMRLPDLV